VLDGIFVALSRLGYAGGIWIVIAVVASVLWRRPSVALYVAVVVWSADLISLAVKEAVDRPRPFVTDPAPPPLLLGVLGDSFPSGHAATSGAGALMLARYLPARWLVFALLAVGIAFSRVYVGVHYPADVLAGAALGLAVATALPMLAAALRRSPQRPPAG
jgi:undecaprenyl-diphosphatase